MMVTDYNVKRSWRRKLCAKQYVHFVSVEDPDIDIAAS